MKEIHLWGVKQNNLKNIEVKIPIGSFTVVCGPSGSGKSSLAFETLFAEGQRRFIESMSNYARQFLNKAPKPDVEGVENIPPAICIQQKNSIKNSRSTVGTTTELIDYFRLLFEKIGEPHCPTHHIPTHKESPSEGADILLKKFPQKRGYILVEISEQGRVAQAKKLQSLLMQEGYLRFLDPKDQKMLDMSEPAILKKGLPKESFYLVIDRMAFTEDEKGRLVDSITQAYEASIKFNTNIVARRCVILTTEQETLNLSEENSCAVCGYMPPPLSSKLFSFNSPVGACPTCKGFGNTLDVDEAKVVPNPQLSLSQGALHPFTMPSAAQDKKDLMSFCKKNKIDVDVPWEQLPAAQKKMVWNGTKDFMGVKGLFEYLEEKKYKMHVRVFIARYRSPFLCPECQGSRLRHEVNHITVHGYNINQFSEMTIEDLNKTFHGIQFTEHQEKIASEVFKQIRARLSFLIRVGVHYLSLQRETRTLSGGEYQRLILANQLGMGLSQTLYVLDEPTVGLHPRDNDRLISILKDLQDLGNTLVVVEHDHDVIQNSDHIIEMGPGSGYLGGQVVYSGVTSEFYKFKNSNTVPYLLPQENWQALREHRPVDIESYKYKIEVLGARGHNLKKLDVIFPLNRLVTVTGVSGSGKSTLVTKTLYPALARELDIEYLPSQAFDKILGGDQIKNVLMIDQSSIGKSARSSPITYLKAFDAIRDLMAHTDEAKARSYTPGTFSLNVDGGRCPVCKGTGYEEIDMMFMDNVIVPCDVCDGKKFRAEILEIKYKDKNVYEILQMTVSEAMNFFVASPNIRKPLSVLKEVGLDYITLGQPASTLSGGESQRLKIAKELSQISQKSTLYILDEPTTGLHFKEIELLLKVLNKLIEAGGSVILVEHNLDVIRASDYIIDLGPEAGYKGGQVVFEGTPEDLMNCKKSLTGQYLKKYIQDKQGKTSNKSEKIKK